ncbi:T-box transcription factor mls-1-like [Harmonia axyridis]|uniref:T-box transcription factor mls-1-like n=1 Tax=Harmonia axyridis TaxID=115357 RepID=UPI001E279B78|nr:T-box transcription factor mls-1-like [Harmonia axyridis]
MYNRYNQVQSLSKIWEAEIQLVNKELWERFHRNDTEMIITKTGRRIFPIFKINVKNLDPHKNYCFMLEMQATTNQRLRFTNDGGWTSCGVEDTPPSGIYVHPESPSLGKHWMAQAVSFDKCKLTNNTIKAAGSLTLTSMHRYRPKVILVEADSLKDLHWSPSITFNFPETEFIAVTAYQNTTITSLKIDHNPFAKGFRENGKSRKNKRKFEEALRERRQNSVSPDSSDSENCSSSSSSSNSSGTFDSPSKKTCSMVKDSMVILDENRNVNVPQSFPGCENTQPLFRPYNNQCMPMVPQESLQFGPWSLPYPRLYQPKVIMHKEPTRSFTDFSINRIMGS